MLFGLILVPAHATLTIGTDCTSDDGPPAYYSHDCNNACTYDSASDKLTCDMRNVDPNDGGAATAYIVQGYDDGPNPSSHDYNVFGVVDNTGFCCTIDEDSTDKVLSIELIGTPLGTNNVLPFNGDTLRFSYDTNSDGTPEHNLKPASAWSITATVLGGAGPDRIYGSDYQGGDYADILFGQDDNDVISGLADKDYIDGGNGIDDLEGNGGNDVIVGGCGCDQLKGNVGADTLCDWNGTTLLGCGCNTNGCDVFEGGDQNDIMWFADTSYCSATPTFDGGNGAEDSCGDDYHWQTQCEADTDSEVYNGIEPDCSFP